MPKDGFRYSKHALDRMSQRGITKKEVEEAVLNAKTRIPQLNKQIKVFYTKNRKTLIVIYIPEGSNIKIISTF